MLIFTLFSLWQCTCIVRISVPRGCLEVQTLPSPPFSPKITVLRVFEPHLFKLLLVSRPNFSGLDCRSMAWVPKSVKNPGLGVKKSPNIFSLALENLNRSVSRIP